MIITRITTPLGYFQLFADENGLRRLLFPDSYQAEIPLDAEEYEMSNQPVVQEAQRQLTEYLEGKRHYFTLPLNPEGTVFQRQVWNLLSEIPYGTTRSYGQLAGQLGDKNKARAVGGAANANPLPIIIPCHRLIGTKGNLTGYAGGLTLKKYLLELEGRQVINK